MMGNLNILYVEDDPRAAQAVQALVLADGDRLAWEQTGTGGLQRAGAENFDVIILDRMLPAVSGMVIDVPVKGHQMLEKGDILFRMDPTPFESRVK